MRTNAGLLDRGIRVAGGIGVLSLLAIGPVPGWGLVGLVGLIPVVSGSVGYFPLYGLLGIDTRGQAANEGFLDRAVRVVVGVGILSLLAIGPVPGWGLVGLVGLVPLVTGVTGYCPGYVLLGIHTRQGGWEKGEGR